MQILTHSLSGAVEQKPSSVDMQSDVMMLLLLTSGHSITAMEDNNH